MARVDSMGVDRPSQLYCMGLTSKKSGSLYGSMYDRTIHGISYTEHSTEAALGIFCYTTLRLSWLHAANRPPNQCRV